MEEGKTRESGKIQIRERLQGVEILGEERKSYAKSVDGRRSRGTMFWEDARKIGRKRKDNKRE